MTRPRDRRLPSTLSEEEVRGVTIKGFAMDDERLEKETLAGE